MAYAAVKGGEAAIGQSLRLLDICYGAERSVKIRDIVENMPFLIDQVMSEAGLYAPEYAALALKQGKGSIEEAVFLLRAYRSTLRRDYYSIPADCGEMRIQRRISASFKDVPGGQILGPTFDYSHRLLDFGLRDGEEERGGDRAAVQTGERSGDGEIGRAGREAESESTELHGPDGAERSAGPAGADSSAGMEGEDIYCPRVDQLLQEEGIMEKPKGDDTPPFDVTSHVMTFPAPRSARLQTLARSESGFLEGVAYSAMRGYGAVHPTVSELRAGWLSIEVPCPTEEGESICIGEIFVTEVEALWPSRAETDEEFDRMTLSGGYGCVFGRNETKAIAMSIADASLNTQGPAPSQDEEFVLTHGDCLEMQGFISHLKLPHYVTFQSKLDRVREKGIGRDTGKEGNND